MQGNSIVWGQRVLVLNKQLLSSCLVDVDSHLAELLCIYIPNFAPFTISQSPDAPAYGFSSIASRVFSGNTALDIRVLLAWLQVSSELCAWSGLLKLCSSCSQPRAVQSCDVDLICSLTAFIRTWPLGLSDPVSRTAPNSIIRAASWETLITLHYFTSISFSSSLLFFLVGLRRNPFTRSPIFSRRLSPLLRPKLPN